MTNKLFRYIKENKLTIILFIIVTSFFIYQHFVSLSWDFNSYVLNGKYWFAEGKYFEPLRPPLMPLIISLFSFLGWRVSEFIFIILTSFLFMYSSHRLAKSIKFNPTVFYAISLNFYLLNNGLINGTELLSLVFLELFLTFLIESKSSSGFFLGLSALSRYTGLALFPLIFMHLKIKQIFKSLILFGATLSLWFIYNYYKYGNFFTSITDQYVNNILYRDYIIQPMQLSHFLQVQNILIPFFLIGVIIITYKLFSKIKILKNYKLNSLLDLINRSKIEIIMLLLLFYSIYNYYNIPIKNVRYLFNLVLPTFYFSYIGLCYIVKKIKDNKNLLISIAIIIFIVNIFIVVIQIPYQEYDTPEIDNSAINKLDELKISNCSVMSNSWVMLNYLNKPSLPFPRFELINQSIEQGQIIILFKHVKEPNYVQNDSFIKSLPIIYEDKEYIIIGVKRCLSITSFEDSYLQQMDNIIFSLHGYHINQNPCFILFGSYSFIEKTCNFINLNGFKLDEHRAVQ
jgi:hypothetical protein